MRYLLDSDIVSDFYEISSQAHSNIRRKLASLRDEDSVSVSVLSLYEMEYGLANAHAEQKPALRQRIQNVQSRFSILELSLDAAKVFGHLKKSLVDSRGLKKKASKSHNIDLILAATAVAESCVLVSADSLYRDLQAFEPNLNLENWCA
ncbi:MAG TPA: type II toxin-antitoxin system VapC family toxin [Thermoanaerobaculia bacterium]